VKGVLKKRKDKNRKGSDNLDQLCSEGGLAEEAKENLFILREKRNLWTFSGAGIGAPTILVEGRTIHINGGTSKIHKI